MHMDRSYAFEAIDTSEGSRNIDRLLVGVDSSEGAQHALDWTRSVAARVDGSIVLAHAYPPWIGLGMTVPPFDYDAYRAGVESAVDKWALSVGDVSHETRIVEDDPAEALMILADEHVPGLIVVGAHPRRSWTPHLLGSVTSKVLHASRTPVAVVPLTAPTEETGRGLLVGVDGSRSSLRALRWAADWAAVLDVPVYALCAVPVDAYSEQPRLAEVDSFDPVGATLDALRTLAAQVGNEAGRAIASDVVLGHPADRLVNVAEDFFALVVGKTGHGTFSKTVLGSTSRNTATHAPVAVVVVP
jgi:nucleotide-binding universal stress UspA family protein